jgi:hypothetical protein
MDQYYSKASNKNSGGEQFLKKILLQRPKNNYQKKEGRS